jgi:soluble lytic murein transglycosylase-like protein
MLSSITKNFGVDHAVMAAIFTVESNWDPYAVRYEPRFDLSRYPASTYAKALHVTEDTEKVLAACSWGLGQIMGATARGLSFAGPLPQLCDPYQGALWAVKYMKRLEKIYPQREGRIAAYNAGSVRLDSKGEFINKGYVEKVLKHL